MKTSRRRGGFTLVEIAVSLTIVAVLAGLAIPSLGSATADAEAARVVSDVRSAQLAVVNFTADNPGQLPRRGRWGEVPPDLQSYLGELPFEFKTIRYRLLVNQRRGIVRLRVRYPRNDPIGEALRSYRRGDGTVVWRRRNTDFFLTSNIF